MSAIPFQDFTTAVDVIENSTATAKPELPEVKESFSIPVDIPIPEKVDDVKSNLGKDSVVVSDIESAEKALDMKMKTVAQISKIEDLTAEHLAELNDEFNHASYQRIGTENAGASFHRFVLGNTPAGNMFVAIMYTLFVYALVLLLTVGSPGVDGFSNSMLSVIMRYVFFPTTSIFGSNALLFIVDFAIWYTILFKLLMKRIELVGFKTWLLKFFGSPVGELPQGFWYLPFWKINMYAIDQSMTCELSRTCRIESVEVVSPTTLVKWKISESFVDVTRDPNDNTFNLWNYQNKNGTQSDHVIQNAVENAIRNAAKLTVTVDQQVFFNNFTNMFAYEFAKLNPQVQKVGYRFVAETTNS